MVPSILRLLALVAVAMYRTVCIVTYSAGPRRDLGCEREKKMTDAFLGAAAGTGFTFACTAFGAAAVFLIRGKRGGVAQTLFLGFAAGVMIAASVWSLLIPAIERAEEAGQIGWIPAAGGLRLGRGIPFRPACPSASFQYWQGQTRGLTFALGAFDAALHCGDAS